MIISDFKPRISIYAFSILLPLHLQLSNKYSNCLHPFCVIILFVIKPPPPEKQFIHVFKMMDNCFHGAFATGVACQQGAPTPSDT